MLCLLITGFSGIDRFATTIAIVGYLVVFVALVLLYLIFYNLPAVLRIDVPGMLGFRRGKIENRAKSDSEIPGEVNAAIGMAIFLYMHEMHDEESGVITIKKVSKRYSPWSSKIYGLRQNPRH